MDIDVENKGAPPEDMIMYTILYVATKNKEGYIFKEYQPEMINKRLAEGLNNLHNNNDLKKLFKYIIWYLLNQISAKASIKKLRTRAEEALY